MSGRTLQRTPKEKSTNSDDSGSSAKPKKELKRKSTDQDDANIAIPKKSPKIVTPSTPKSKSSKGKEKNRSKTQNLHGSPAFSSTERSAQVHQTETPPRPIERSTRKRPSTDPDDGNLAISPKNPKIDTHSPATGKSTGGKQREIVTPSPPIGRSTRSKQSDKSKPKSTPAQTSQSSPRGRQRGQGKIQATPTTTLKTSSVGGKLKPTPVQTSQSLPRGRQRGQDKSQATPTTTSDTTPVGGKPKSTPVQTSQSLPRGRQRGQGQPKPVQSSQPLPRGTQIEQEVGDSRIKKVYRKAYEFVIQKWRTLTEYMKPSLESIDIKKCCKGLMFFSILCVIGLLLYVKLVPANREEPGECYQPPPNGSEKNKTPENKEVKNDSEINLEDIFNKTIVEKILDYLKNLTDKENEFENLWRTGFNNILENLTRFQNNLTEKAKEFENNLLGNLTRLQNNLTDKANDFENNILGNFTRLQNNLTDKADEFENNILGNFTRLQNNLTDKADESENNILGNFTRLQNNFLKEKKAGDFTQAIDDQGFVQIQTSGEDTNKTEKINQILLQIDIWGEYMSFRSFCFVLGILGTITLIILPCSTLVVLLLVYKRLRGQKTELQPPKPAVSKPIHEGNLEDSLCIVSFDESSSKTNHLTMTRKIADFGELKLQTKRVVIKKDSLDVLKDSIPPSKVFLVYIDYNEGNVILDKSESGTRRQTVKYLMKTNALVFIVYCLEKSSENLEELYAQKLTTIKTDPVLVDLSKRDRVFSIYKTFSKKQMEVIVKGINEFTKQSV